VRQQVPSASGHQARRRRRARGSTGPRRRLAIVVHGGVVQGVYADRCAPLIVYLLDYDDLRADDDLAEDVGESGALPQVPIEAGLARAMAEYRAVATRQARVRRPTIRTSPKDRYGPVTPVQA
jgi:hypothetical protein